MYMGGGGGGVMQQQGKRNRQNRGVPNFSKQMNISNCLLIIQRGNGFFVLVICWAIWTVRLGRKDPVPHPHSTPLLMFFCLLTVLCIALNFMIWASKPARQSTGSFVHPEQASREGDVSTHLVKVTPPPLPMAPYANGPPDRNDESSPPPPSMAPLSGKKNLGPPKGFLLKNPCCLYRRCLGMLIIRECFVCMTGE